MKALRPFETIIQ